LATRGITLVFWTYALLTCGISFVVAGLYGGNRTTILTGVVLLAFGAVTALLRKLSGSGIPLLLRSGAWTIGRVLEMAPGSRTRRIRYEFAVGGAAHVGNFLESKPWADDFQVGADTAVIYDPTRPERSVPLSPSQVEIACEGWKLR